VEADEPALLASIKRHDFRSFMTILPGVRAAMDKASKQRASLFAYDGDSDLPFHAFHIPNIHTQVVKEHLIYKYARVGNRFFPPPTPPPSASLPAADTAAATTALTCAVDLWEVEDVDPERILAYEGDAPGNVYYLSEGQVRLHRGSGQGDVVTLGPGALLGARAAVLGEPERFTVVTDKGGPCVFLKLGADAVCKHLAAHPSIRASLETLFRRRHTPLATLLECPEGRRAFAAHLAGEFTGEHLV